MAWWPILFCEGSCLFEFLFFEDKYYVNYYKNYVYLFIHFSRVKKNTH